MQAGRKFGFAGGLCLLASMAASSAAIAQSAAAGGTGLALHSADSPRWLDRGGFHADNGGNSLQLPGVMPSILSRTDTDAGFKFSGGYQFGPSFALQGGFTDPRRIDAMRDIEAPAFVATSSRASGFRLDAVGIVPLRGGFSLFGKIGTLYSPARDSLSTGGGMRVPAFVDPGQRRFDWNANYGLGASYDVSSSIGLHFKYERANSYYGDARTAEPHVGTWSFGLIKRY